MSLRILLVDDQAYFRVLVKSLLAVAQPEAQIEEYDPAAHGRPPADFPWVDYDLLLLDYKLGSETAIDWLERLRGRRDLPPIILFTGEVGHEVAVRASRLGVAESIKKCELDPDRLASLISEVTSSVVSEDTCVLPANGRDELLEVEELTDQRRSLVNGYKLERRIGSGATSVVFLARREMDGREVVLKVLKPEFHRNEELFKRFVREYQLISKLDSRHVVRIYNLGFSDRCAYIAMEYFANGTLRKQLKRKEINGTQALIYTIQVAMALRALHGAGVVHRDIKPDNVMIRDDGWVALVDLGIAKAINHEQTLLTEHGQILGTPHYMSPEQMDGNEVDGRSDLYSLGVLFYEMIAGTRPYEADSLRALILKQLREPVPPLPEQGKAYEPIIMRLLEKDREKRYADAGELLAALEESWPGHVAYVMAG